jgi:hypothetical protein
LTKARAKWPPWTVFLSVATNTFGSTGLLLLALTQVSSSSTPWTVYLSVATNTFGSTGLRVRV